MTQFVAIALQKSIVKRASLYAVIVGPALILINHGDAILAGQITRAGALKMLLTMTVPYLVSTFSSVAALRNQSISAGRR